MQRHPGLFLTILLVSVFPAHLIAQPQRIPLQGTSNRGQMIIVEGTVNETRRVNMMIDTGATCSVVSKRLAKELRLHTLLENVPFNSNDRLIHCPVMILPSIGLGPIHRPLSCPSADLPVPEIDLIVGRDVLRTATFMVDFTDRHLEFGLPDQLEQSISFDPSQPDIIVPLQIGQRAVPVKLDTGADALYLLENSVKSWLQFDDNPIWRRIRYLSIESVGTEVPLSDVRLGGAEFRKLNAVVLKTPPGSTAQLKRWHGLLGLGILKAKRVQFDLKNGRFGWEQ